MSSLINLRIINLSVILILTLISCNENKKMKMMQKGNETSLFTKGDKASQDWFTGKAFIHPLLTRDKNNEFALGSVTFEPGSRTLWHTHPKGQVLIVTEGQGWYQEKGKLAQAIVKGDVINIPRNVEHWHGASAENKMVHIAITNYMGKENVTWMQSVTDQEYNKVNQK